MKLPCPGKRPLLSLFLLVNFVLSCSGGQPQQSRISGNADSYLGLLSKEAADGFAKAIEPREFVFPADHAFHPNYLSEWLYFAGIVQGTGGEVYGYQLTFFRFSLAPASSIDSTAFSRSGILMGHFAVTDVAANTYQSFERFGREGAGIGRMNTDRGMQVWLDNWKAEYRPDGTWNLFASAGEGQDKIAIKLDLRSKSPPLLHGDRGYSRKGPEEGQANYYYSLVQLNTNGTFFSAKQEITVEGTSWMDHEWGTSALPADSIGWDWFGLQLEDGTALMAARVRLRGGGSEPNFLSTLLTGEGISHQLNQTQVSIKTNSHWQSPSTGIVYPASWTLSVSEFDLECQVDPLVSDQEFIGSTIYWEGAVKANCLFGGIAVQGSGYTELTGYDNHGDT